LQLAVGPDPIKHAILSSSPPSSASPTQLSLLVMREMFEAYNAMWMEGTWEIDSAQNSPTKFIISDDPVTFFNRKIYPAETPYSGDDDFPKIGTRTIFPLGPDFCLIITHLQLIRNPWCKPLETRVWCSR
jgi:hypothetical protein